MFKKNFNFSEKFQKNFEIFFSKFPVTKIPSGFRDNNVRKDKKRSAAVLNAQRREAESDPKRLKFEQNEQIKALSTCSDSDQSGDDSTGLNSPSNSKETGNLPVWLEQERNRPYFPLFLGQTPQINQPVVNSYQLALDLRMKLLQTPLANPLAQHLYLKAKEAFVQRNYLA